jgi:hypothetical protein
MRVFQDVLAEDYGLDSELNGWTLREVVDISSDGRAIVGNGINPQGKRQAWIVVVPEPTISAILSVATLLALRRRRHDSPPRSKRKG